MACLWLKDALLQTLKSRRGHVHYFDSNRVKAILTPENFLSFPISDLLNGVKFNSAYFPAFVATRAQIAQRRPAMASLSRSEVIRSKPIADGLNVFRDSFNSLCEGLGVSTSVDGLQHIDHEGMYSGLDCTWFSL